MVVVFAFNERDKNVGRKIKNVDGHHDALHCELCTRLVTAVVKQA